MRNQGEGRGQDHDHDHDQETSEDVSIRPMQREDLDELMAIETSAYRSPWGREVFLDEMHRGWAHVDVLREEPGGVAGPGSGSLRAFVNYWIVGDEVHVLNVATHPEARRRGYASRLLEHLTTRAEAEGCRFITLEVRRKNRGAIRLYRRHGLRPVGLRPHYYEDGEDAIVMLLELAAAG